MKLYEISNNYDALLNRLYDCEIDEQAVYDTLEALEGELVTKAENIAKIESMMAYEVSAIEQEIKRLTAKKKTIENGQSRLKKYLFDNMKRLGMDKLKGELFTVSIRKNPPKLIIDDPDKVPASFLTIVPEHYEINNPMLKDALKAGEFVTGAHIEQGESLQIK